MSTTVQSRRKPDSNAGAKANGKVSAPDVRANPIIPDDNTYDPGEQYPEVEIGRGLTAQLAWVTPEVAADWLGQLSERQRSRKKHHLISLVEDLKAGRFRLNGETIVFDSDGSLINGQHRLTAVVETGIPILTVVVRNVPPSAYVTLDCVSKRTAADALRSSGYANAPAIGGAANLLRRYERGVLSGMENGSSFLVLSPIAVEEIVAEHPGLVASTDRTYPAGRYCHSPAAVAFCHYLCSRIDAAAADDFFHKLGTGEDLARGSPILALRNKAHDEKHRVDDLVHLILKAWNAWRKGRTVMILRVGDGEMLPKPH